MVRPDDDDDDDDEVKEQTIAHSLSLNMGLTGHQRG
jgi:hypothetical protein